MEYTWYIHGIVFVCATLATVIKISKGKKFEEWIWPIIAMIWCFNSIN